MLVNEDKKKAQKKAQEEYDLKYNMDMG